MFLENIDKSKISKEEPPPTPTMVADRCLDAAGSPGTSKGSSEQNLKGLLDMCEQPELRDMDSSLLGVDDGSSKPATMESCKAFESHSASCVCFESNQTLTECDNLGLSQTFDKHAQHGLCSKPSSNTHEQRANQSLSSQCSPCCECCLGHLQLFQQCPGAEQQLIGQYESSAFILEESNHFELIQDYDPCECLDTSTEDATHLLDCSSEFCEFGGILGAADSSSEEENVDGSGTLLNKEEKLEGEEEETLSPSQDVVYFEETKEDPFTGVFCEADLCSEDDAPGGNGEDADRECRDFCDNEDSGLSQESEPSQHSVDLDQTDEFYAEEDSLSECSSGDSKPCESSPPACWLSSEEALSDGPIEWESFEEELVPQHSDITQCEKEMKETAVDVVVEDFFSLFDRFDFYDHTFPQTRRYISCFDGGDIDDRLFNEEKEAQKEALRAEDRLDVAEITNEDDANQTEQWEIYLAEDEGNDGESCENNEGSDEDEDICPLERVSGVCDEQTEPSPSESLFAPRAEDIDAYEDDMYETLSDDSLEEEPQTANPDDTEEADHAFSEQEPYWSLVHYDPTTERWDGEVEDYYRFEIPGVQPEQALKQCIWKANQKLSVAAGVDSLWSDLVSPNEGEPQVDFEGSPFESPEVVESNDDSAVQPEELIHGVTRGTKPPMDIIHSVSSESGKTEGKDSSSFDGTDEDDKDYEQSRDSEEELSDDDEEPCECEYCIPPIEQEASEPLLPLLPSADGGRICVAIDLDETLVHSSFKPVNNADFIIPVEIDGAVHQVSVLKRPHVDEFLRRMGGMFECVLFTASLSMYADPVSDVLDQSGAFQSRLFREACVFHRGNYVKDLSRLGRDLNKVIIIDNSPASYALHPDNAVPVVSWFDDSSDTELLDLLPLFERLSRVDNVLDVLRDQSTSR